MEFALGLAIALMAWNTTGETGGDAGAAADIQARTTPVVAEKSEEHIPYFADELMSRNVELARHDAPNPAPQTSGFAAFAQASLEPTLLIAQTEQLAALPMKQENVKLVVTPRAIQWELRVEDGRLDKAIRRWAKEAGYTFRWDADRYVMIAAGTTFSGTFEYAVEQVLETPGIKNSEYPLEACVYNNEPPLLRITRLGDQKEECR